MKTKQEQILDLMPKLLKAFDADWDAYHARALVKYPNSKSTRKYEFEKGSTYIRISATDGNENGMSCCGFVQYKDGKFPAGTIIKSAGWKAPATNFGRGDIFDKSTWDCIKWTGVM